MKETKLVTELDDKIVSLKLKILCGNDKCSSRDDSTNVANILLLIYDSYKCPYCRGDKFILIKK